MQSTSTIAAVRQLSGFLARVSMGFDSYERTIHGVRWAWIEAGPRDGEPLILLHGFEGSKDNWILMAPLLAQNFRVICPDLPGCGDSMHAPTGDYSIGEQSHRVVQFIDALELGPCHLAGHGMGGFIALTIALDAPDVVAALILLNNTGIDGWSVTEAQTAIKNGRQPFDVRTVSDVDALLAVLFHRQPRLPLPIRGAIVAHFRSRTEIQRLMLDQIVVDAAKRPLNRRLHEISVPVLLIWGESNKLLHISAAQIQHQAIAGSSLVILNRTGHMLMLERPFRTALEIRSFLLRIRGHWFCQQSLKHPA